MSARNLAIVITPNILYSSSSSVDACLSGSPNNVVRQLIQNYSKFFREIEMEMKAERSGVRQSFLKQTETKLEEEDDDEEEDEEIMVEPVGSVVKEGWLTKKGEIRHNWTKRWFVLKYGSLGYFRTQGFGFLSFSLFKSIHFLRQVFPSSSDGLRAAGRIVLVDCLVGQSTGKKPNCFAITTPTKRTFLISANSPQVLFPSLFFPQYFCCFSKQFFSS